MASSYTDNPIRVESGDAAATVRVSRLIYVTAIVWDQSSSGANADQAVVQDKNANVRWSQTIQTGNLVPAPFQPCEPIPLDGLVVPTLGHGTLFIYWKAAKNG